MPDMDAYLLHNTTLIDGTGADPVPQAAVLVENGTISWAGPEADYTGAAVTRVDLGANTLCPGFFDCHVHFALPGASGSPWSTP